MIKNKLILELRCISKNVLALQPWELLFSSVATIEKISVCNSSFGSGAKVCPGFSWFNQQSGYGALQDL